MLARIPDHRKAVFPGHALEGRKAVDPFGALGEAAFFGELNRSFRATPHATSA